MTHYWKTFRILMAIIAVAALALGVPAAPSAQAAGLINCVDLSVQLPGRPGACQESVWANGVEYRMVFPQEAAEFPGARPADAVGKFYVIAPQTATPQGALPFPHDHTVTAVPGQDTYSVLLHGYLVFCSEQGITTGACVPFAGQGLPLAQTVNGQPLTSADTIEAAAAAGLVTLLDTNATYLGIVNPGK